MAWYNSIIRDRDESAISEATLTLPFRLVRAGVGPSLWRRRRHTNFFSSLALSLSYLLLFLPYCTMYKKSQLILSFHGHPLPITPSMRLVINRLRTFSNWCFARATLQLHGFFSLSVRDQVKCFYCKDSMTNLGRNTPSGIRPQFASSRKARCQAKFLTCYCLSDILFLRIRK